MALKNEIRCVDYSTDEDEEMVSDYFFYGDECSDDECLDDWFDHPSDLSGKLDRKACRNLQYPKQGNQQNDKKQTKIDEAMKRFPDKRQKMEKFGKGLKNLEPKLKCLKTTDEIEEDFKHPLNKSDWLGTCKIYPVPYASELMREFKNDIGKSQISLVKIMNGQACQKDILDPLTQKFKTIRIVRQTMINIVGTFIYIISGNEHKIAAQEMINQVNGKKGNHGVFLQAESLPYQHCRICLSQSHKAINCTNCMFCFQDKQQDWRHKNQICPKLKSAESYPLPKLSRNNLVEFAKGYILGTNGRLQFNNNNSNNNYRRGGGRGNNTLLSRIKNHRVIAKQRETVPGQHKDARPHDHKACYWKQAYIFWPYYEKSENREVVYYAMDVETVNVLDYRNGKEIPVASQVMIIADFGGRIQKEIVLYCTVNWGELFLNLRPEKGSTQIHDVLNGLNPELVKEYVLICLKGKHVFVHSAHLDFGYLGITHEELMNNEVKVIDLARKFTMKSPLDGTLLINSLKDLVLFFQGQRIQEYKVDFQKIEQYGVKKEQRFREPLVNVKKELLEEKRSTSETQVDSFWKLMEKKVAHNIWQDCYHTLKVGTTIMKAKKAGFLPAPFCVRNYAIEHRFDESLKPQWREVLCIIVRSEKGVRPLNLKSFYSSKVKIEIFQEPIVREVKESKYINLYRYYVFGPQQDLNNYKMELDKYFNKGEYQECTSVDMNEIKNNWPNAKTMMPWLFWPKTDKVIDDLLSVPHDPWANSFPYKWKKKSIVVDKPQQNKK